MRSGICGSYLCDLGLLSNFKSVRNARFSKQSLRNFHCGLAVGHFW